MLPGSRMHSARPAAAAVVIRRRKVLAVLQSFRGLEATMPGPGMIGSGRLLHQPEAACNCWAWG